MTRARLVSVLLACLIVSVCDIGPPPDPGTTPTKPSGIRGMVLLGPTCPIGEEPDPLNPIPCLTPYAAQLVILDADNQPVGTVSSGVDGRFEITLPAGDYVVTPRAGDQPFPIAQPLSVTVVAGEYAEVEINYDTGIR